jgi:hypothetical protein
VLVLGHLLLEQLVGGIFAYKSGHIE